jgi:hypothetical protein
VRTRCDNHRAGRDTRSFIDVERVPLAIARQPRCAFGDDDLRSKFQRLRIRAGRQVEARNAGREAQVIFNT